jgi:hypothetical protein
MGVSSSQANRPTERRSTPDRRIPAVIQSQEALARIVADTRGNDSYAGRALQELNRRRALTEEQATGEDALIVYSMRGQWLVGTVREIRAQVVLAAEASCRRLREPADPPAGAAPNDTCH